MNKVIQRLYTISELRDNRHRISKSWECWFLSCLALIAPLSSSAWIFIWSLLAGKSPTGFMLLLALVLSWCKCELDNANLKCWREDLGLYHPWSWLVCPPLHCRATKDKLGPQARLALQAHEGLLETQGKMAPAECQESRWVAFWITCSHRFGFALRAESWGIRRLGEWSGLKDGGEARKAPKQGTASQASALLLNPGELFNHKDLGRHLSRCSGKPPESDRRTWCHLCPDYTEFIVAFGSTKETSLKH